MLPAKHDLLLLIGLHKDECKVLKLLERNLKELHVQQ